MTIRTRLWVSHLISLIVPIIMTILIIGIALLGLVFYIDRGNYIYVEHLNQYNIARQVLTTVTFRELDNDDDLYYARTLYHLFDPQCTFITVTRNNSPIEVYGNPILLKTLDAQIVNLSEPLHSYSDGHTYFTTIARVINNNTYRFTIMASNSIGVDDKKLQFFFNLTLTGIILFIILSIWLVNKFLTRFTMRHILRPLKELTSAAREVELGNFKAEVSHLNNDEFMPITFRFNIMVNSLYANKQQRQAEEQSRRELIAGISHDLRTPLTSIKAYVEGLIDGVAMNDDMRIKYLNTIQKKTILMDNMLEQLFLFSKLDLGDAAVKAEPILLHEMIRDYVKDNYDDFLERGLDITVNIQQTARIKGDISIFIRILQNMLTNSVKYKDKDLGHSRICLSTTGQKAIITVTDDGPGVPEDKLNRLFEVFYRTDKARTSPTDGSGLGLAIAQKYITLMGGTISATNVCPHGLQITITIPLISNDTLS